MSLIFKSQCTLLPGFALLLLSFGLQLFFFSVFKFLSLPTWRLKAKLCRHVLQERLFLKLSIFLLTILPFIQKTGNVRLLWNVQGRENLEKAFCLKTGIEDSSKQRELRDVSVEIFHIDVVEIGSALCSSKNWQGRKLWGGFCWGFLCYEIKGATVMLNFLFLGQNWVKI